MKKSFQIYLEYEGMLCYFDHPKNKFFTYQEAETFLIDQANEHLFDKYIDYTILTIFNRE